LIAGCNTSVIPMDGSVTSIGFAAFFRCTGLTSITIPNSVTSVDSSAFYGCTGLMSIIVQEGNTVYHSAGNCLIKTDSKKLIAGCKSSVIPTDGSVTSIGTGAFRERTGLTSITIPDSVTSIGDLAFYQCTGLTTVYYTGTADEWSNITVGSSNDPLTSAAVYFYSEAQPTEEGNYWHYVDGVPTVWQS